MKISIVTPTFNSEKTILDTCKSITSQTYQDFEHIVIDNYSTDKTIDLIKKHYQDHKLDNHLKIIIEKDKGISDAFNKGINRATGEIVAILNSDDFYLNSNLFYDISKIFLDGKINLVHGKMLFQDEMNGSNIREPLLCPIQFAMPFNHPTCFVRKSLYVRFGLFKLDYRFAMDYEWVVRFYNDREDSQESYYFDKYVMTLMRGDGVSNANEIKAVEEFKRALIENNKWNNEAATAFKNRVFRVKLKIFLNKYNLFFPIKIWRAFKWR